MQVNKVRNTLGMIFCLTALAAVALHRAIMKECENNNVKDATKNNDTNTRVRSKENAVIRTPTLVYSTSSDSTMSLEEEVVASLAFGEL